MLTTKAIKQGNLDQPGSNQDDNLHPNDTSTTQPPLPHDEEAEPLAENDTRGKSSQQSTPLLTAPMPVPKRHRKQLQFR